MTGNSIWENMLEFWLGFLGFCWLLLLTFLAIILALPTGGYSLKWWDKLF